MSQTVLEILRDFDLSLFQPIRPRALDLGAPLAPRAGNLVKVIVGMRRSGKSYRLLQEMETLHQDGVPWNRMCYFNFEDDRLDPVTSRTGDDVLESFESLNPGCFDDGVYLFFDEIQEMEDWGTWLRRISDTRRVTIYVTGSSSKMLSSEIATEFRGRAIDYELLPLSFAEYLEFNELMSVPLGAFSRTERIELQSHWDDYLATGGFPGIQGLPRQLSVPVLQSYVQRVVSQDVVERHNISKPRVPALFAQRLLGMNARQVSLRKIENDLRSVGISTSRELLGDVLSYFEEAYLLFTLKDRRYSLAESSSARSKAYAIDPGLALANSRANANDRGQRLENAVYLELRRRAVGARKDAISSFKTDAHGYEIDFVTGDALDGALDLYQVCDDVEDERTLSRELRALWEALEELGLSSGTLIVGTGEDAEYVQDGRIVHQIPVWKWLVQPADE